MERLKNMDLKKAFFVLSVCCIMVSLLILLLLLVFCGNIRDSYPAGGIEIRSDGTTIMLEGPTKDQQRILKIIDVLQLLACILLPAGGLGAAGVLFYHIKLKMPIAVLQKGTERILNHDLDFSVPEVSKDELGQICRGFETMRAELLKANQELWEQAEERKRLNAAFSHDLRNPVTVLKGTIKLIRQGKEDGQAFERLEDYVLRIENYVEAMSGIQKLEQLPFQEKECAYSQLHAELLDTVKFLAPAMETSVIVPETGHVKLDHGIFLNVAENLIRNGARFAQNNLSVYLEARKGCLLLTVADDGSGYPEKLLQDGPRPFGKMSEETEHFGMGLYSARILCLKHRGSLELKNPAGGGASATAIFRIN